MASRDIKPVSHSPIYKRIAIGSETPEKPTPPPPEGLIEKAVREVKEAAAKAETDRIWRHVVQTAQGTNAPSEPAGD